MFCEGTTVQQEVTYQTRNHVLPGHSPTFSTWQQLTSAPSARSDSRVLKVLMLFTCCWIDMKNTREEQNVCWMGMVKHRFSDVLDLVLSITECSSQNKYVDKKSCFYFRFNFLSFLCVSGTGGTNQAPEICAQGHYCPNGTQYPNQYPCPAGSYSNKTNLANYNECWECPKGFYCVNGSVAPQGPCPAGYYCPPGKLSWEYQV